MAKSKAASKVDPYKALDDMPMSLLPASFGAEGVVLLQHIATLRERDAKDAEMGDKPKCPICKDVLRRVKHKGYYDQFVFWDCGCGDDDVPIEDTYTGGYG